MQPFSFYFGICNRVVEVKLASYCCITNIVESFKIILLLAILL